jgi:UPF0755 protein
MDTELQGESFSSVNNQPKKRGLFFPAAVLLICFALVITILHFLRPPASFPTPYFLRVSPGETLFAISRKAEEAGLVRSARTLQLATILSGGERSTKAGDYYFDTPVSVWELARRLSSGDFHITPVRVTFPEGYTVKDMGKTLENALPEIRSGDFIMLAKRDEGKLFPDTYFFSPAATVEEIYKTLKENFEKNIASLRDDIAASGRTEKEIIVMASLIEREAFGENDREIISGILWKRFDRGMLLQVDAPFYYLLGKTSAELTKSDLKINSPYNTYVHTGLPPTPIGAPGLASLKAAISPKESPYLFYLHDSDGVAHYAKNFSEHQANIRKYLR